MKIVGILVCLFSLASAEELLNIETLPSVRTRQYPLGPYEKIVVFSAPRTGSSLVYNTFKYLFEDQKALFHAHNEFNLNCFVLKTHMFDEIYLLNNINALYVVTLRNPFDAIISNFRICPHKIKSIRDFVALKVQKHKEYLHFYEWLKQSGKNVIFLKYEDFEDRMEYLFERIEGHFGLKIEEEDKNIVKKGYGKENVYSSIQGFSDFKEYLPLSGFHGNHIPGSKYTPPEELIYWLNLLIEEIKPGFKKYGYFLSL